jgi:serine/threonine protein kinase
MESKQADMHNDDDPVFEERRVLNVLHLKGGKGLGKDTKFTIEKMIGQGRYSTILKCRNLHDDKSYAIKVVPCKTVKQMPNPAERKAVNHEILQEIKREFDLGNLAAHPNVVENFGYGQD